VYFIRKQLEKTTNTLFDFARISNALPVFDTVKNIFEKHIEDDYMDFYYERNIPELLSREGPKAATGDVNKDGLMDIFIGGTKGHPGKLYLQTSEGSFIKKEERIFSEFIDFEDEAVLFFDADNDGDLDLYLGPGGNSSPPYSREMQHRLFKNDGNGNFNYEAGAFPVNGVNIAVAIAHDFDHDGDEDLFVGGRSVPRDYGISPSSYIYVNDGKGHFTDIAKTNNAAIANIGMVTGAVWADVTGDKNLELIISGEWMSPRIFSYNGKNFAEIKSNLNALSGLWQSIAAADVNGDGKTDLVLGNIGENFYLRPSKEAPVKIWMADVDKNGDIDKIITSTTNGTDKPVFLKNDLQDQIPMIKKGNLKHQDYAKKTIQELFNAEVLKNATVKEFNYSSSCIAINKGNGNFEIQKLPLRAQLS
ncbi:MAG: FG-GAP repeat domain-containing protein, partial [Segetibacter sp.]